MVRNIPFFSYAFTDVSEETVCINLSRAKILKKPNVLEILDLDFSQDVIQDKAKRNKCLEKIRKFVGKNKDKDFLVICDFGLVRSYSVAISILKLIGKKDLVKEYIYNNQGSLEPTIITSLTSKEFYEYAKSIMDEKNQ